MSNINYVLQAKPKRIALIDDRGVIISVYPSQTDAAVSTETDQSAISKVCRGLKDNIKGKKFKEISEKLYKQLKKHYQ